MKKIKIIITTLLWLITITTYAEIDSSKNDNFKLEEATIDSIHDAIINHKTSCEDVIASYISRIKNYNLSDTTTPSINAIARINPNVFEQAKTLDQRFLSDNRLSGPLHCIPVILKDNIDSYDSESTSGSLSLLGNQPVKDAFLASHLRAAGAIILGKSTMDEFASGVSGISGGNGRVGNVYDTTQNPGGSSSGSAAAVSANFTVIGIGTDNSGSIRVPAAFNGIFGLRPSTGLISQRGIFPRGNMDGIAGPMARTIKDLAVVLDVIADSDTFDRKTTKISRPTSYTEFLNKNGLQGKRIGIITKIAENDTFEDMPEDTKSVFKNAIDNIQKLNVAIINNINLAEYNLDRKYNQAGEKNDINKYLASYPSVRKNYKDICISKRTSVFGSEKECLKFNGKLYDTNSMEYKKALEIFSKNKNYVEEIMDKNNLDALLIPVSSTGTATYNPHAMRNEKIASNAGLPGITINVGYTPKSNMPIGFELIGRQYSEGKLIEMAYAYEQSISKKLLPPIKTSNSFLERLDINQYNNLLTQIGYDSYEKVLTNSTPGKFPDDLTANIFQEIVIKRITMLQNEAYKAGKK